jgi:rubredoxin
MLQLSLIVIAATLVLSSSFHSILRTSSRAPIASSIAPTVRSIHRYQSAIYQTNKVKIDVSYEEEVEESTEETAVTSTESDANAIPLSTEEQYKKDKLAEIAEKKAQEVFLKRTTGKYECQACGYVYNVATGLPKKGIAAGTPFEDIEKFRCPECGANKKYFVAETETVSGFKQNQKFGFGGNTMTGEAKGALIYGGLFIGFALFLGGYLLE